jgi:hypothetical protein
VRYCGLPAQAIPKEHMPRSICVFEKLMLGSLLIGVVISAMTYNEVVSQAGALVVTIIEIFVLSLMFLLVLFVSRKRSNIAKWILIIVWLLGLVIYIPALAHFLTMGTVGVLFVAQPVMQAGALYMLFRSDSKSWFESNIPIN